MDSDKMQRPVNGLKELIPSGDAMMTLDAEREVIAAFVETATDAHDLHAIAAWIRARKGKA